jgi:hypothetical protein
MEKTGRAWHNDGIGTAPTRRACEALLSGVRPFVHPGDTTWFFARPAIRNRDRFVEMVMA